MSTQAVRSETASIWFRPPRRSCSSLSASTDSTRSCTRCGSSWPAAGLSGSYLQSGYWPVSWLRRRSTFTVLDTPAAAARHSLPVSLNRPTERPSSTSSCRRSWPFYSLPLYGLDHMSLTLTCDMRDLDLSLSYGHPWPFYCRQPWCRRSTQRSASTSGASASTDAHFSERRTPSNVLRYGYNAIAVLLSAIGWESSVNTRNIVDCDQSNVLLARITFPVFF